MIRETGNWTDYRRRFNLTRDDEVDLHLGRRPREIPYYEAMDEIKDTVASALREAQEKQRPYIMFTQCLHTVGQHHARGRRQPVR
jgi:hypothetical protein